MQYSCISLESLCYEANSHATETESHATVGQHDPPPCHCRGFLHKYLTGEYNLTFATWKKSAQGREFKVYKEREGKMEKRDEIERKGGRKE